MIISVASGKGGTGKTTLAVSLAHVAPQAAYVDCDVEAPNGHIFLRPSVTRQTTAYRTVASVDEAKCTWCGKCMDACAFHAIVIAGATKRTLVFDDLCTGCGVCSHVCPEDAIREVNLVAGVVTDGMSNGIVTREGRMDLAASHASPTLKATLAALPERPVVILDAEPGVTGRVVETVRKSRVCLLVTEPTPFGRHDLELALAMTRLLEIPAAVVINRCDVGDGSVSELCRAEGIPVLLEIPFDRRIAAGYAGGKALLEVRPDLRGRIEGVLGNLLRLAAERPGRC